MGKLYHYKGIILFPYNEIGGQWKLICTGADKTVDINIEDWEMFYADVYTNGSKEVYTSLEFPAYVVRDYIQKYGKYYNFQEYDLAVYITVIVTSNSIRVYTNIANYTCNLYGKRCI